MGCSGGKALQIEFDNFKREYQKNNKIYIEDIENLKNENNNLIEQVKNLENEKIIIKNK